MSSRSKLLIAVFGLILAGGSVAAYKCLVYEVPFLRGSRANEWQVEARVNFLASGEPLVKLALPTKIMQEQKGQVYGSLDYSFDVERERDKATAIWSSTEREDGQVLFLRIQVPVSPESGGEGKAGYVDASDEVILPGGQAGRAAKAFVEDLRSRITYPDSIFNSVCAAVFTGELPGELALVLRYYEQERGDSARAAMAIDLLSSAGAPARMAHGVLLDIDAGSAPPLPLIEYHDGAVWKVRNPIEPGRVLDGASVFVWHRGGGPLLEVTDGEGSKVTFTVAKERIPLSTLTDLQDSPVLISTIMGLPLSERAVFRYLVLIPLGAFVVVIMRNLIGVPTLGTFMPVLIALALLEIPLAQGLLMFSVLTAVGLWIRFLLSRLNLLVVPRVAACVVIVTLLMMLMSVIGYKLGIVSGAKITLFPMIILAWTIERMSIIWEEEGKRNALSQVAGSLLVAVLAFLFMSINQVQYWAFYFPELLLVLLAGILLIGRYTGYRISELVRFKSFSHA